MTARLLAPALFCLAAVAPVAAQQTGATAIPPEVCDSVRTLIRHQSDSVLALRPDKWRPDSSNRRLIEGMRDAEVVVLVRMDTLGKPDIRTFRPVRWRDQSFVTLARQQIANLDPTPYEPFAGCRVSYVLTLPFNFSLR